MAADPATQPAVSQQTADAAIRAEAALAKAIDTIGGPQAQALRALLALDRPDGHHILEDRRARAGQALGGITADSVRKRHERPLFQALALQLIHAAKTSGGTLPTVVGPIPGLTAPRGTPPPPTAFRPRY